MVANQKKDPLLDMDFYLDCISNVMPDLLTEDFANCLKLAPARRFEAAMRYLRQCPKMLNNLGMKDDVTVCRNFSYSNWDHHFQEEINDALRKIPLQQLASHPYSSKKLISLGWSVLAVYRADKQKNSCLLGLVIDKLLKEKPTIERTKFFEKLWGYVDELDLPVSLFDNIVTVMPMYLENLICTLVQSSLHEPAETCKCATKDVILRRGDAESWLKMCSKSPKIFQISASIINMLLLHSGEKAIKCLIFIEVFLCLIKRNGDQVHLYPAHLQSLVTLMSINPESLQESDNVYIVNVSEKLIDGLTMDRATYLCLLSHFPYWIKYLPSNYVKFAMNF